MRRIRDIEVFRCRLGYWPKMIARHLRLMNCTHPTYSIKAGWHGYDRCGSCRRILRRW